MATTDNAAATAGVKQSKNTFEVSLGRDRLIVEYGVKAAIAANGVGSAMDVVIIGNPLYTGTERLETALKSRENAECAEMLAAHIVKFAKERCCRIVLDDGVENWLSSPLTKIAQGVPKIMRLGME